MEDDDKDFVEEAEPPKKTAKKEPETATEDPAPAPAPKKKKYGIGKSVLHRIVD